LSDSNKKTVNVPKDVNTLKLLFIRVLEESYPHLETFRERGWAAQMLETLKTSNPSLKSGGGLKPTGIVRHIDDLGRLVLPKELRRTYGVDHGSAVEISKDELNGMIIIQPFSQSCHFCSGEEDIHTFKEKYICESCLAEAMEIL
jgi:transcriptional pleiotropic regulator of transition state genes